MELLFMLKNKDNCANTQEKEFGQVGKSSAE